MPNVPRTFFGSLIIWIIIGVVMMTAFRHLNDEKKVPAPHALAPATMPVCGSLPPSGTTSILDFPAMHHPDAPHGVLGFKNEQHNFLVAMLLDVRNHPIQVITLAPGGAVQVKIPSRQYGLQIMTGTNWCNFDIGFMGGTRHQITGGVGIQADTRLHAVIKSSPSVPGSIDISYQTHQLPRKPSVIEEITRGGLEIQQGHKGFATSGTINGVPINFLIDTGASGLTIPSWFASHAGITKCSRQSMHSTANGDVMGCESTVAELTFGPFRLINVDVSILPNLKESALLGMNVLRQFNMVWAGDRVRISAIGSQDTSPSRLLPDPSLNLPLAMVVPWPVVPQVMQSPLRPPQTSFTNMIETPRTQFRTWLMQYPPEVTRPLITIVLYLIVLLPITASIYIWQRRKRTKVVRQMQARNPNYSKSKRTEYYNPKEFRTDKSTTEPPKSNMAHAPQKRLLTACCGDKARMERLMEYESRKAPFISDSEAAKRALERLVRDRS